MRSTYAQLANDKEVNAPTTLLRTTINLARPDSVYVQTDGAYRPHGPSAANVYIAIDGQKATNDSLVDWRTSQELDAHPFDAVGAKALARGRHTIELRAEPASLPLCVISGAAATDCRPIGAGAPPGSFDVLAGANLSVLVHPATHVSSQRLAGDAGPFDLDTGGYLTTSNVLTKPLPFTSLVSSTVPPGERAVALGSGWLYASARVSDAMLAVLVDGRFPGDDTASWANQDLWYGAELRAAVSVHAFIRASKTAQRVALGTVEFPWASNWVPGIPDNPVVYSVAAGSGMTLLSGGLAVAGVAGGAPDSSPNANSTNVVVGSNIAGWGPPTGTNVELASAVVRVPHRSPGVVLFSAKTRTHPGDGSDTGWSSQGALSLWITVDNHQAGPRVLQEVGGPGDSGSQRTIATSYLAAGANRLKPGIHRVAVWGRADGHFFHAWMWRDAPLIWFD